ncbi:general stress protein [Alkalicoccus urumqiensis]|uniref:Uncharacterized protein n=1 Tax=Alkalicoccus urumqiensis TaxID=1548213 RepID=A0A2P6MIR9_ALKUR|nr:general stress protein [Alkalicoccus urumqiensis]PRO66167.1 hypothetical protein C6I21_05025 [Alkalicoccus urumqiensis]
MVTMEKQLHGFYESAKEAAEAVEDIRMKGSRPEEIVLVCGDRQTENSLRDQAAARVEVLEGEKENTPAAEEKSMGFMDKVKTAFKGQTEFAGSQEGNDLKEPFDFTRHGFSKEDADQFEEKIGSGSIAVLIPADLNQTGGGAASEEPAGPSQIGDPMSEEDPASYAEEAPEMPKKRDVPPEKRDR